MDIFGFFIARLSRCEILNNGVITRNKVPIISTKYGRK